MGREGNAGAVQKPTFKSHGLDEPVREFRLRLCHAERKVAQRKFERVEGEVADFYEGARPFADLVDGFRITAFHLGWIGWPPLLDLHTAGPVRHVVSADLLESQCVFLDEWVGRQLFHAPAFEFIPQTA
ncbi:hypothetical protein D3C87_1347160 [compost metagenome]